MCVIFILVRYKNENHTHSLEMSLVLKKFFLHVSTFTTKLYLDLVYFQGHLNSTYHLPTLLIHYNNKFNPKFAITSLDIYLLYIHYVFHSKNRKVFSKAELQGLPSKEKPSLKCL